MMPTSQNQAAQPIPPPALPVARNAAPALTLGITFSHPPRFQCDSCQQVPIVGPYRYRCPFIDLNSFHWCHFVLCERCHLQYTDTHSHDQSPIIGRDFKPQIGIPNEKHVFKDCAVRVLLPKDAPEHVWPERRERAAPAHHGLSSDRIRPWIIEWRQALRTLSNHMGHDSEVQMSQVVRGVAKISSQNWSCQYDEYGVLKLERVVSFIPGESQKFKWMRLIDAWLEELAVYGIQRQTGGQWINHLLSMSSFTDISSSRQWFPQWIVSKAHARSFCFSCVDNAALQAYEVSLRNIRNELEHSPYSAIAALMIYTNPDMYAATINHAQDQLDDAKDSYPLPAWPKGFADEAPWDRSSLLLDVNDDIGQLLWCWYYALYRLGEAGLFDTSQMRIIIPQISAWQPSAPSDCTLTDIQSNLVAMQSTLDAIQRALQAPQQARNVDEAVGSVGNATGTPTTAAQNPSAVSGNVETAAAVGNAGGASSSKSGTTATVARDERMVTPLKDLTVETAREWKKSDCLIIPRRQVAVLIVMVPLLLVAWLSSFLVAYLAIIAIPESSSRSIEPIIWLSAALVSAYAIVQGAATARRAYLLIGSVTKVYDSLYQQYEERVREQIFALGASLVYLQWLLSFCSTTGTGKNIDYDYYDSQLADPHYRFVTWDAGGNGLRATPLGRDALRKLASALASNRILRSIDLSNQAIDVDGATLLASEGLSRNNYIEAINLRDNKIKGGAIALLRALRTNTNLVNLDLSDNQITDAGAGPALRRLSKSLMSLRLSKNHCTFAGAAGIVWNSALRAADCRLQVLDLSSNPIDSVAYTPLAEALGENRSLLSLNLATTGLGKADVTAVIAALTMNRNFRYLNLAHNDIENVVNLAEMLMRVSSLEVLILRTNLISQRTAQDIVVKLQNHRVLRLVDISLMGIVQPAVEAPAAGGMINSNSWRWTDLPDTAWTWRFTDTTRFVRY